MYKAIVFDFFGVLYVRPHWNFIIDEQLVALIKKLKKEYKIVLLSNSNKGYVRKILNEQGLEELFDSMVVSGEVGYIKPDIKIFELTLEKLDVKAEETIFIDDNAYNTDAAETIGIKGILYKDLATLRESFASLNIDIS